MKTDVTLDGQVQTEVTADSEVNTAVTQLLTKSSRQWSRRGSSEGIVSGVSSMYRLSRRFQPPVSTYLCHQSMLYTPVSLKYLCHQSMLHTSISLTHQCHQSLLYTPISFTYLFYQSLLPLCFSHVPLSPVCYPTVSNTYLCHQSLLFLSRTCVTSLCYPPVSSPDVILCG